MAAIIERGFTKSMSCPIKTGMIMLPKLLPAKNQPVIWPVSDMFRSANDSVVGKMGAIKSPRLNVPAQIAIVEAGNK